MFPTKPEILVKDFANVKTIDTFARTKKPGNPVFFNKV